MPISSQVFCKKSIVLKDTTREGFWPSRSLVEIRVSLQR